MKNQKIAFCTTALMLSVFAIPTQAKIIDHKPLEDHTKITIVSEGMISKGIAAYKAGNYPHAVWLIKTFISERKVVVSPIEKEGLKCLTLAYQKLGKRHLATKTIERLKSSVQLPTAKSTRQAKYNGYNCS